MASNPGPPDVPLASTSVAVDPDLSLVHQQLLASVEAAHAAALEASTLLEANPGLDGTRLAEAMGAFLDTQGRLFVTVRELVRKADSARTTAPHQVIVETDPYNFVDLPRELVETSDFDDAIGELPEDWGHPQEWVEAPQMGRLFRRRSKKEATVGASEAINE